MPTTRRAAPPPRVLLQRSIAGVCLVGVGIAAVMAGGMGVAVLVGTVMSLAFVEWVGLIKRGLPTVWAWGGIAWIGLAAAAFLMLYFGPDGTRDHVAGRDTLFWIVGCVAATDIFAFIGGRNIGGPKLAPSISPAKTWSGLIVGIVAAAAASALVGWLVASPNIGLLALAGAVVAVVAQAGDLLESRAKRLVNVKDTGTLIPGHGGVLDRFDGLIAACIVAALAELAIGGSILAIGGSAAP